MMRKFLTYIFLFASLTPLLAQSQVIQKAEVSRRQIYTGDSLTFTLKVNIPASVQSDKVTILNSENWAAPFMVAAESMDTTTIERSSGFDILRTYKATLIGFDTVTTSIPALAIFTGEDTLFTEPIEIDLKPIPIDTAQGIADIVPPADVNYGLLDWLKDYWQWPVGITLLAVLIGLALYFISKRTKLTTETQPEAKPVIIIPAHVKAIEALEKLKADKSYNQGDIKVFYSAVSEIFRRYLEERYRFQALEFSTSEIVKELQLVLNKQVLIEDTKRILNLSDMVKYAKGLSTENEAVRSIDLTINFIQETKAELTTDKEENEAL